MYAELIANTRQEGSQPVLSTAGEALVQSVGAGPYLLKANLQEAGELVRRRLERKDEIAKAAREISQRGVQVVVISMGMRGAILGSGGQAWVAEALPVTVASTAGAGVSLLVVNSGRRRRCLGWLGLAAHTSGAPRHVRPDCRLLVRLEI